MRVEKIVIDSIETKRLLWYEHLERMNETRWPTNAGSGLIQVEGKQKGHQEHGYKYKTQFVRWNHDKKIGWTE